MSIVAVVFVVVVAWFMFGAIFGNFCVEPDKEGETGKYVADVEHDNSGKVQTGIWLELGRRWEQFGCPICRPINKLLRRG